MLDALLGMAAVFAKEKAPDAMLGALGSLASLLGEPVKRGLTRVRDRHFGAPRPAAAHLQQAVWVAFHAAIAERLESACKELDDAILVASVDRDPTDLTELSRRREAFADIRKHADAAASEMAARLDDPSAEPPDWTSALLTELPGYIVWPPQEAVVRASLHAETEAALRDLALRRARALNPHNDIDQASLAALFQGHDGPGDWLAAYARQFSQLV